MHGIVVLDKPAGESSNRALAQLREVAKVGHAGTLDPFATGVLLALVGDATRLSSLAMQLKKTYRATVRFGWRTDTLDTEGEVVEECDPGGPRDMADALAGLTGEILQIPPAHSAKKIDGQRAYKLARAGKAPAMEPRKVVVHAIAECGGTWPEVELEVVCGAGTYVRSLARDLGATLGLPASLIALRRIAIGPYRAEDADASRCRPALELIEAAGLTCVNLDRSDALRFVTGRPLETALEQRCGLVFSGRLLGVGKPGGTECVFASARRAIEAGQLPMAAGEETA